MPFLSCLERWLALLEHSADEAILREAWQAVSPHLFPELARMLQAGESGGLEPIWERLQQEDVRLFLEYLCSESGLLRCSAPDDRIESALLLQALQVRLQGAGIAAALIYSDRLLLNRWLGRLDAPPARFPEPFSSPELACNTFFRELQASGVACGELEDWTACLLHRTVRGGFTAPARRVPSVARRCPVLIHRSDRTGLVGWLTLERLDTRSGELFPDTFAMGLTPLSHTFRTALALAAANARRICQDVALTIRWRIQSGIESWEGRQSLEGGSHGAAFAVALIQLLRNEPLDAKTALTMTLDAQGEFGPVSGVYAKVQAACALRDYEGKGQIQRIVVHPENAYEARFAAEGAGRDPDATILACSSLEEYLPEAGGHLRELRQAMASKAAEREAEAWWRTLRAAVEGRKGSHGNRETRSAGRCACGIPLSRKHAPVRRRRSSPTAYAATARCCRLA